jgi:hypothetical protein
MEYLAIQGVFSVQNLEPVAQKFASYSAVWNVCGFKKNLASTKHLVRIQIDPLRITFEKFV